MKEGFCKKCGNPIQNFPEYCADEESQAYHKECLDEQEQLAVPGFIMVNYKKQGYSQNMFLNVQHVIAYDVEGGNTRVILSTNEDIYIAEDLATFAKRLRDEIKKQAR
jgi:hypothetical protein